MEKQKTGSIWDQLPDDWNDGPPPASTPTPEQNPPGDSEKKDPQGTPVAEQDPGTTGQKPGTTGQKPGTTQQDDSAEKGKKKRRSKRKKDRKKLKEYEKSVEDNRIDGGEHVKKAYDEERAKNQRDFLIVGIVLAAVLLAGIAAMVFFSQNSTQKIYDLVDQGNYGLAYQQIQSYHENGKNVDAAVYYFAERCVGDSEYKRAVAALAYLSPDAAGETDFFADLVETLIAHNKENRAREVLAFMRGHSEALRKSAEELAARYGL